MCTFEASGETNAETKVLDILHTHPSHQNRGAGAQLVRWGTDLADRQHLQCYLEASPSGYPFFRKLDFHDVTEMEIDLNRYRTGYHGTYLYKHIVMIRPPDVPPIVPPKDARRATLHVVNGGPERDSLVTNGVDDADRSKSVGNMPESEGVGGWNFGLSDGSARSSQLLDKKHFSGERESNYMDTRDSEYLDSNRSSLI